MEAAFLAVLTIIMWAWLWLVTVLMGAAIGVFIYYLIKETLHAIQRKRKGKLGVLR